MLNASSVADFLAKIDAAEKERFPEEAVSVPEAKAKETDKGKIQVLAVTACPRIGVDELSVSPAYVLPLHEKIRSLDLSK